MDIDRERWAAVYREAFPRLYRALVATLLDREVALDAVHDAFYEGLQSAPEDLHNVDGWLYRVALRKARRSLVRRSRSVPLSAEPASAGGLDLSLDRLETGRLLALLTERQRAIVVAHYYLGLTQAEVAATLGIRRGTVGATIAQSLRRMRRQGSPNA